MKKLILAAFAVAVIRFGTFAVAEEAIKNVAVATSVSNTDNCILLAQKEFADWLKDHPYQKDAHKIDLKLLCGREFGEPCDFLPPNKIASGGSVWDIQIPFPPFKKMYGVYGAQPEHPLFLCHFGWNPIVEPDDLIIKGDYENEAKLLKERFENLFGIEMLPLPEGKGYEYYDGYNWLKIALGAKLYQGSTTNILPLVVDISDFDLHLQNSRLQEIYRKVKQSQPDNQEFKLIAETPHSIISEFGYGKLRFGDQMPADEVPYSTNDISVSTRYEPMYGSREIKDDNGFAIAMKWYYLNGQGLYEIDLSPGAGGSLPPEGYDEAFRKFDEFKGKLEKELSISLPDIQIDVSKDEYDKTIVEHKEKEAEEAANGRNVSCEWTVFSIPSFDYKGVRFFIRCTAWTKYPTTIHMNMRKIVDEQKRPFAAEQKSDVYLQRRRLVRKPAAQEQSDQRDAERQEQREQSISDESERASQREVGAASSLRNRRLLREQQRKREAEEKTAAAQERRLDEEALREEERLEREAERAEQRAQLQQIRDEMRRAREARAANSSVVNESED